MCDNSPEAILVLPAGQAADRIPRQVPLNHLVQTPLAQPARGHVQATLCVA